MSQTMNTAHSLPAGAVAHTSAQQNDDSLGKAAFHSVMAGKASPHSSSSSSSSPASGETSYKPEWQPALHQLLFASLVSLLSLLSLSSSNYVIQAFALFFSCFGLSLVHIIAMDCVHQLFTPNTLVNRVLGELALFPFLQPFATHQSHEASSPSSGALSQAEWNALGLNDGGHYDDSKPITAVLKQKMQGHTPVSAMAVYAVQAALLVSLLYSNPLAVIRYWLLPVLLYPFVYPTVHTIVTNNIHAVLAPTLAASVPSYHLSALSTAIQELTSGAANKKARAENKPQLKPSRGVMADWKDAVVEVWPRLHWVNIYFVIIVPIIGFIGSRYVALTTPTMIWAIFYYIVSGLGITAGYHRLFAHRSYEAHPSVLALMMVMGTAALQGSIKWWCGGHRIHHRYTDTDLDPYSAKSGFFYAHIGWMMVHPRPEFKVKADLKDLNDSAMIRWQHKNYLWFGPFISFVLPTLVAGLGWGDWAGGFIYAGCIRLFAVHHATFCVNSVAHWFGEHTFDDTRSPRDHFVTALLTFGEGYHNFHHEFPNDYRNGIRFFDYDPTKWVIKAFNLLGLTYKLRVFPSNEIEKGKVHMKEKQLAKVKASIVYPPSIDTLPLMDWNAIREGVKAGRKLTVIDDLVHDISTFIVRHPGGKAFIESSVGCDASVRFRGETGIYKHSQAAHHLLSSFRIARLSESEGERLDRKMKEEARLAKFNSATIAPTVAA